MTFVDPSFKAIVSVFGDLVQNILDPEKLLTLEEVFIGIKCIRSRNIRRMKKEENQEEEEEETKEEEITKKDKKSKSKKKKEDEETKPVVAVEKKKSSLKAPKKKIKDSGGFSDSKFKQTSLPFIKTKIEPKIESTEVVLENTSGETPSSVTVENMEISQNITIVQEMIPSCSENMSLVPMEDIKIEETPPKKKRVRKSKQQTLVNPVDTQIIEEVEKRFTPNELAQRLEATITGLDGIKYRIIVKNKTISQASNRNSANLSSADAPENQTRLSLVAINLCNEDIEQQISQLI